jgi:DNA-binding CsgD family transcriptional regulator
MNSIEVTRGSPWAAHAARPAEAALSGHAMALALFDEIECGLIVCAADGTVRFANQAAQRELAAARVLTQVYGALRRTTGASGEFDTALRLAAQRGRRSLVRLQHGADRLMVSVLPLPLQGMGDQQVLVMLGRRQPCSELGLEMLAASHGLTMAERRVLAGLLRQTTPRQIAAENAVSLTTVRTQISAIRAKLGARSIEALLMRAAELPPVASALRMGGAVAAPAVAPEHELAAA